MQAPGPEAYPLFLRLEFSKLIEKMNLRPEEAAPAETAPDITVTVELRDGGKPGGGSCWTCSGRRSM